MFKRTFVRLLLFGIPFGLAYWAARPVPQVTPGQIFVVCASPGDQPGELRISLDTAGCTESGTTERRNPTPAAIVPAVTSSPEDFGSKVSQEPQSVPF